MKNSNIGLHYECSVRHNIQVMSNVNIRDLDIVWNNAFRHYLTAAGVSQLAIAVFL